MHLIYHPFAFLVIVGLLLLSALGLHGLERLNQITNPPKQPPEQLHEVYQFHQAKILYTLHYKFWGHLVHSQYFGWRFGVWLGLRQFLWRSQQYRLLKNYRILLPSIPDSSSSPFSFHPPH